MAKNKSKQVGPFIKTGWGQGHPYNYQLRIPGEEASTAPLGCVGVAGGQIMAYYKHPHAAKGTIYSPYHNFSLDVDGFEYDWDNMPDKIFASSEQKYIDAVSNLLYHCRIAADTVGPSGKPLLMFSAFVENFGYDNNIGYIDLLYERESYFSYEELQHIVKTELDAGRPVQVGIPGHAIVCDGYRESDGKFSFNYGWGTQPYWYYLDDSKEGCQPVRIYTGIRPDYKRDIEVASVTLLEATYYPGSKSVINAMLRNISDSLVNSKFRLYLSDNNKVNRGYISEFINIRLDSGEQQEYNIEVVIPESVTFGPRNISIEYISPTNGAGSLFDNYGNVLLADVDVKRVTSDKLILSSYDIPQEVFTGDSVDATLQIHTRESGEYKIQALLIDNFTNAYKTIGHTEITVESDEIKNHLIPLDFDGVKSQAEHKVIFVVTDVSAEHPSLANIISLPGGEYPCRIYVKNTDTSYTNLFTLETNMDKSIIYYAEGKYKYTLGITASDEIPLPSLYRFSIKFVDEHNNILSMATRSATFDTEEDFSQEIEIIAITPAFNIDGSEIAKDLMVHVSVGIDDEDYKLIPRDASVQNPDNVTVYYRNNYDNMYIARSLELQANTYEAGDTFILSAQWTLTGDNYAFNGTEIVTATAVLTSATGDTYVIGKRKGLISINIIDSVTVQCSLPDDIPQGEYTLFIRASDALSENGPVRPKMLGLTEDIIDEVNIFVV